MSKEKDTSLADDRLDGIAEIAAFTGDTYREAQWHIERGHYPVFRVGKKINSLKSVLRKVLTPEAAA
jgi:hypothetical protein